MKLCASFFLLSLSVGLPTLGLCAAAAHVQNRPAPQQWSVLQKITFNNSWDRHERFELSPDFNRLVRIVYQQDADRPDWGHYQLRFSDVASGDLLCETPWEKVPYREDDFWKALQETYWKFFTWSPDGTYGIFKDIIHANQVILISARTGQRRTLSLEHRKISYCFWDPQSCYVSIVASDLVRDADAFIVHEHLYVFNAASGERLRKFKLGRNSKAIDMVPILLWSPTGRYAMLLREEDHPDEVNLLDDRAGRYFDVYEVQANQWKLDTRIEHRISLAQWLDDSNLLVVDDNSGVHKLPMQNVKQARLQEIHAQVDDQESVDRFPMDLTKIIADYDVSPEQILKAGEGLKIRKIVCGHQGHLFAVVRQGDVDWMHPRRGIIKRAGGPCVVEVRDVDSGQLIFERTYDHVLYEIAFLEDDSLLFVRSEFGIRENLLVYDIHNPRVDVAPVFQSKGSYRLLPGKSRHIDPLSGSSVTIFDPHTRECNKLSYNDSLRGNIRWSANGKQVAFSDEIYHPRSLTVFGAPGAPFPVRGNRFWSFLRKPKVYGSLLVALALAVGGGSYYAWWKKHRLPLVV